MNVSMNFKEVSLMTNIKKHLDISNNIGHCFKKPIYHKTSLYYSFFNISIFRLSEYLRMFSYFTIIF